MVEIDTNTRLKEVNEKEKNNMEGKSIESKYMANGTDSIVSCLNT